MNAPCRKRKAVPVLSFVQTSQILARPHTALHGFNLWRLRASKTVYKATHVVTGAARFYLCATWRLTGSDKHRRAAPRVNWETDFQSLIARTLLHALNLRRMPDGAHVTCSPVHFAAGFKCYTSLDYSNHYTMTGLQ